MLSRPGRSRRSHPRVRRVAAREDAHMDETRRLVPSSASQACGTRSQRGGERRFETPIREKWSSIGIYPGKSSGETVVRRRVPTHGAGGGGGRYGRG